MWNVLEFLTAILWALVSLAFEAAFLYSYYLAARAGIAIEVGLIFYGLPAIAFFFITALAWLEAIVPCLIVFGNAHVAAQLLRVRLRMRKRWPGKEWFWTMPLKARIAECELYAHRAPDTDKEYKEVLALSEEIGHWGVLLAGSSCLIYSNWLKKMGRADESLTWRARFQGALFARRAWTIFFLALVLSSPRLFYPILAPSAAYLTFLGEYKSADSLLRGLIAAGKKYKLTDDLELRKLKERMTDNYEGWGWYEKSIPLYRELIASYGSVNEPLSAPQVLDMAKLAYVHTKLGDYNAAESIYKRIYAEQGEATDAQTGIAYGDLYAKQRKYKEAEERYNQVLNKNTLKSAKSTVLLRLGDLYAQKNNYPEAKNYYDKALALLSAPSDKGSSTVVLLLSKLAEVSFKMNDQSGAESFIKHAKQIVEGEAAKADTLEEKLSSLPLLYELAHGYDKIGDLVAAEATLSQVLSTVEGMTGQSSAATASALADLAQVKREQNQKEESERLRARALEIARGDELGPQHPASEKLHLLAEDNGQSPQSP